MEDKTTRETTKPSSDKTIKLKHSLGLPKGKLVVRTGSFVVIPHRKPDSKK